MPPCPSRVSGRSQTHAVKGSVNQTMKIKSDKALTHEKKPAEAGQFSKGLELTGNPSDDDDGSDTTDSETDSDATGTGFPSQGATTVINNEDVRYEEDRGVSRAYAMGSISHWCQCQHPKERDGHFGQSRGSKGQKPGEIGGTMLLAGSHQKHETATPEKHSLAQLPENLVRKTPASSFQKLLREVSSTNTNNRAFDGLTGYERKVASIQDVQVLETTLEKIPCSRAGCIRTQASVVTLPM